MATLLLVNPRFDGLVRRHRLDDFDHVMRTLAGRQPGGHVDRDVRELRLDDDGRMVRLFLKREYKTSVRGRLMNWFAGFGRATRSRREWYVLMALLDAGIGCAEPVVYGERGTIRPVGYLILYEIERSVPLTEYLLGRGPRINLRDRRQLAAHIGHEIARMHEAGITHPDLYSKHVFLSDERAECPARSAACGVRNSEHSALRAPSSELPRVSFLDLQRGGIRWSVSLDRRAVDLAALDATLSPELASATDRLTFLQSYLSHVRPGYDLQTFLAAVRLRAREIADRAKIREMRETRPAEALHALP